MITEVELKDTIPHEVHLSSGDGIYRGHFPGCGCDIPLSDIGEAGVIPIADKNLRITRIRQLLYESCGPLEWGAEYLKNSLKFRELQGKWRAEDTFLKGQAKPTNN